MESQPKGKENTMNANETLTQKLADIHREVAYSVNDAVAHWNMPIYIGTRGAFLGAIALAYSDVNADDVYNVWADCGEDVAYCVAIVRERRASETASLEPEDNEEQIYADAVRRGVDF